MHLDPILPTVVGVFLVLVLVAILAKLVRQPPVVGYLVAGLLIGPSALGLVTDIDLMGRIGTVGVVLLLFYVGMEVAPRKLAASWPIAVFGTILQIVVTTGLVVLIGILFDWPLMRSILIGFVVSLSSTAIVLQILEDRKELSTEAGQDILGILLVQDLAVIPMIFIFGLLDNTVVTDTLSIKQAAGTVLLLAIAGWIVSRKSVRLRARWIVRGDQELQVLVALTICFGLSLVSGLLHLSTALGAFVAGIVVRAARETAWVESSLHGFRVLFIATFFVSIGMLIDVAFFVSHWVEIVLLLVLTLFGNTIINAAILRLFGRSWRQGLYAGALLSQIGEFSFVLAAVGVSAGIIGTFAYQTTVTVISLSIMISPLWIALVRRLVGPGSLPMPGPADSSESANAKGAARRSVSQSPIQRDAR